MNTVLLTEASLKCHHSGSSKPRKSTSHTGSRIMTTEHGFRRHNKARTGCITCKARRVKCDETKSACLRCVSFGRHCAGYQPLRTWLFEPTKKQQEEPATSVPKALPPTTAPSAERRAYLFFNERTAPLVAPFSEITSKFWFEIVPRVSLFEEHKAIW